MIRELDRDRFEPHVYCPPGPAADLFREAGAIVHTGAVAGFTHIWASTYRGRRWLLFGRELVRLPSHAVQFRRTLRRQRFELVHFNDSPLIPAAWLARHEGLPVVWHLRSALPEEGRDRRSGLIRRAIANLATTSIAINHDVADVFGVGSTIVPNSVDLQRFHPGDPAAARAALGLPADLPVVSFFGFIYPSKGFREFIEAAARLRERGVEASYLVVGGAVRGQEFFRTMVGRSLQLADLTRDYESEAKQLVRELELDDVVRFIPFTQDTANLYQASDVVVAPSQGPELGRPVIEAAASGVPVVASGSRTGGGVVVPGETGVLVDDYGVDSIADAVADLLQHAEGRRALGPHGARPRRGELRPCPQRPPDRGDLRPDPAVAAEDPDPLRPPPAAARRRAVEPRAADPPPRPALRAARVLPGGPGGRSLRRRRRDRPQGRRLDLRARLGLAVRGAALARARPRDRLAAAPPAPARPPDADAPVPARAPERLAAARGRVGRAQPRRQDRLAPALGARRRGTRPAQPADRLVHGDLRRRRDRDRPRRRRALPDPASARDRAQQRARRRSRPSRAARRRSACPRTGSRSASPASSAARRAGRSSSRPPRSWCARARRRTS